VALSLLGIYDMPSPGVSHARILLVDDSLAQCELLSQALARHGYHDATRRAASVDSALAFLEDTLRSIPAALPELILADLKLTGQSGVELARRVRSHRRFAHLPIVMLTTSDTPEEILDCYASGVNGYVVKPSTFEELVVLTRDLCAYWLNWNRPSPLQPPPRSGVEEPRRLC
jgi:CheY-like chemotaxis protein